ncbi:hypothetical protein CDQ84_15760 [Clostridium thermosuccinogenes]|uniref:Lipoprotein n=1 Tax=Clostridium thermosuccinogenes TaxID=84032 RepID=A0A2K2F8W9_9CLOT|nr:hypothetical protein [Pseudoclostridium thermosuccinogenes]AUS97391.1 hypothetical protein CDO33_13645 [Pseudoclostridium thermosuccinogenes]PNT95225.1 hypothetical protein CDQ85_15620 [Pseudoclostridium thermosuccinogenes]PNT96137.1 hypothetical protein CDQ84_15760 [Pseudoclostridium thermosuccinogenes]
MKKKHILIPLLLIMTFIFASCSQLDVIGNKSITSFKEVLDAMPDKIAADEVNGGWTLTAPDNSAKFFWSKDFSKSKLYDAMLEFDAKPFIDAGLDINKLPDGMVSEDKLVVGVELSSESITYDGEATPIASYEKIVELKRDSIGYHAALDHFGVDLAGGNMFEWAMDIGMNDKDIVFVLNPQVFIDAGVDPEKVEGWVFAKVETMDMNGKKVEVDKFLKPFNIK